MTVASAAAPAAEAPQAAPPAVRAPEPLRDLGRAHEVRLAYFVPADREPVRAWREKITVLATFVADLYRCDLRRHGYATRGLDVEFDGAGRPAVHLVRGKHPAAHYSGDPDFAFLRQWRTVLPEVEAALGPRDRHVDVIVAETYDDGPARFEWRGGVALGCRFSSRGGAGLFSAWILRDDFCATTVEGQLRLLADETPIRGRTALGHGRPDSPRFEFIEDGFGAVAHELGHAFGLVHDHREDGRYVMGNGFRNLRRNYVGPPPREPVGFSPANARLLAHSPFLAEDPDLADTEPPVVRLEPPAAPLAAGATEVPLAGRATDDRGLAAAVYFLREMDSVVGGRDLRRNGGRRIGRGGSPHPPRSAAKAPSSAVGTETHRAKRTGPRREADLSATLPVQPLKPGTCRVRVLVIDRGGNIGKGEVTCEVRQ
ncbi:MAG: hypothetical protein R6X20_13540 [Phycisphaerae bacterium]